jgi:hypothetical protein
MIPRTVTSQLDLFMPRLVVVQPGRVTRLGGSPRCSCHAQLKTMLKNSFRRSVPADVVNGQSAAHNIGWHEALDRKCRHNIAGELSRRCERAGKLRGRPRRIRAHRSPPHPKPVLSRTIGSCRSQSARNRTPRGIGQLPTQTPKHKPHRRR